jgi:hypothetical protein
MRFLFVALFLLMNAEPAHAQDRGFDVVLRMRMVDDVFVFSVSRPEVSEEEGSRWCPGERLVVTASRPDFRLFLAGPDGNPPTQFVRQAVAALAENCEVDIQHVEVIEEITGAVWRYESSTRLGALVSEGEPARDLWDALAPAIPAAARLGRASRIRGVNLEALAVSELASVTSRCDLPEPTSAGPDFKYRLSLRRSDCLTAPYLIVRAASEARGGQPLASIRGSLEELEARERTRRTALAAAVLEQATSALEDADNPAALTEAARRRYMRLVQLRADGAIVVTSPLSEARQLIMEAFLIEGVRNAQTFPEYEAAVGAIDLHWQLGVIDERRLAPEISPYSQRFVADVEALVPGRNGERAIDGFVRIRRSLGELRTLVRYLPEEHRVRLANAVEVAGQGVFMVREPEPATPRELRSDWP